MVNYQNGKIYKIQSESTNLIYIGSTTQKYLTSRLTKHKEDLKTGHYVSSSEILKFKDAKIILIELFPCNSKEELQAREAYHIKNNDCVNKTIPGRTPKEHYEQKREQILQYKGKKITCECGCVLTKNHLIRHQKTKKHFQSLVLHSSDRKSDDEC